MTSNITAAAAAAAAVTALAEGVTRALSTTDYADRDNHGHEHHEHHEAISGDPGAAVITAKTITMLVLGLVSLSMGIIPMQLARCFKLASPTNKHQLVNPRFAIVGSLSPPPLPLPVRQSSDGDSDFLCLPIHRSFRYVNVLLGFGGGVLFSTTFLHMMPEVEEAVEHLVEDRQLPKIFGPEGHVPLAKILTCAGFVSSFNFLQRRFYFLLSTLLDS